MAVKIGDIRAGMRGLEVLGRVVWVGTARQVNTRYGPAVVAQALIEDETGSIILNLWRDQIGAVRQGVLVKVENAFVREFGGRLELNIGRDGRITVVEDERGEGGGQ